MIHQPLTLVNRRVFVMELLSVVTRRSRGSNHQAPLRRDRRGLPHGAHPPFPKGLAGTKVVPADSWISLGSPPRQPRHPQAPPDHALSPTRSIAFSPLARAPDRARLRPFKIFRLRRPRRPVMGHRVHRAPGADRRRTITRRRGPRLSATLDTSSPGCTCKRYPPWLREGERFRRRRPSTLFRGSTAG